MESDLHHACNQSILLCEECGFFSSCSSSNSLLHWMHTSHFSNQTNKKWRHKSRMHRNSSKSARWKTALTDLRDPDSLNAESPPDSDPLLDEKERFQFEDTSHAYTKLEGDYQKFLSECGMSNYGYWRGGSPQ